MLVFVYSSSFISIFCLMLHFIEHGGKREQKVAKTICKLNESKEKKRGTTQHIGQSSSNNYNYNQLVKKRNKICIRVNRCQQKKKKKKKNIEIGHKNRNKYKKVKNIDYNNKVI